MIRQLKNNFLITPFLYTNIIKTVAHIVLNKK